MLIRYRNSITKQKTEMTLDYANERFLHDSGRIYSVDNGNLYLIGSYNWPDRIDRRRIRWTKKQVPTDFGSILVGTHVEFFNRDPKAARV